MPPVAENVNSTKLKNNLTRNSTIYVLLRNILLFPKISDFWCIIAFYFQKCESLLELFFGYWTICEEGKKALSKICCVKKERNAMLTHTDLLVILSRDSFFFPAFVILTCLTLVYTEFIFLFFVFSASCVFFLAQIIFFI